MKTDIEIASMVPTEPIINIAKKLNMKEEHVFCYGQDKAKLSLDVIKEPKGKLILVTSTNPTPYGEGKTTISIGLNDGLSLLGKKSIAALREPSLGPVFGIKGGATGGGYAQAIPMEDINLHFTGDIHAVESCNNLLCSIIDNHLFHGNILNINPDTIQVPRAMDMNDRALRKIILETKDKRTEYFVITTASEIMAILCLSENLMDLKYNLSHILVGYNYEKKPIFVSDLHCEDALTILLKDAIKPNLVQSLEHNPIMIHGGPFANIAHGCNSIIATRMALSLADYVVTEAGFGSDLGAFKFMDIKCRKANLKPDVIVLNTTIRSLKYNGDGDIHVGISNLDAHIHMMKMLQSNIIVCLNHFDCDTEEEIEFVKQFVTNIGLPFQICTSYVDGGAGALDLAKEVISYAEKNSPMQLLYHTDDSVISKIETIGKKFYHANDIKYEDGILEKLNKQKQMDLVISLSVLLKHNIQSVIIQNYLVILLLFQSQLQMLKSFLEQDLLFYI